MQKKKITIRRQFLTRIVAILLIIALLSGGIQLYSMNKQIDYEIDTQTAVISQSINQGIKETDLASKSIEHQIDLKMYGYAKHIGDLLNKEKAEDITSEELLRIKEELNLTGLSVFIRENDDIVVLKSTDPQEIGFSARNFGDAVYENSNQVLLGNEPDVPGAYTEKGLLILPVMQSGMHKDEPAFYKYAYYHPEGTDYFVNPFIEADEIYQFTKSAGPDSWIQEMEKENPLVKDISVLNPKVFLNPDLESQFWPPVKKVVYGDYQFSSEKDLEVLKEMLDSPVKQSFVEKVKGDRIIKLFLPQENGDVLQIVLDYQKMIEPLYHQVIILIITGIASFISLFFLIYRLFNKLYDKVKTVISQINMLESGDLTAVSDIKDGTELSILSDNVNSMARKLNHLVAETQEQASKTQKLSLLLEEEASESVEKIYELSTETTIKAREQLYQITEFLDQLEEALLSLQEHEKVKKILDRIGLMREIANERTASTTNTTIVLSDLLKSLHEQSSELSDIARSLLQQIGKFKL